MAKVLQQLYSQASMIDHIRDKIDNPSTPDASGAATGDANKV